MCNHPRETPNRAAISVMVSPPPFLTSWTASQTATKSTVRPGRPPHHHNCGTFLAAVSASSPTLFSVVAAWLLSRRLGAPFVFEVRDLWPAIFAELGVLRNRFILRSLECLEMFLYRRSAAVVTVTRGFAENIERRGIEKAKIHFIPNGVDLEAFEPGPPDAELLARLKLTGRFVVLYCGAHGISHALARVLDAAERLREDSTVRFLFVGEGAEKGRLVEDARQRGLENVSFLPAVPRQQVPALYRSADVCLVPLKRVPLFRTFIPSKMFEILACGRPIIASVEGEAAQILEESGAALVIPPEDSGLLAESISRLRADTARRGSRSRCYSLRRRGCGLGLRSVGSGIDDVRIRQRGI